MIFRYLFYKCEQPQNTRCRFLHADSRYYTCPSHVELEAGGNAKSRTYRDLPSSCKPHDHRGVIVILNVHL